MDKGIYEDDKDPGRSDLESADSEKRGVYYTETRKERYIPEEELITPRIIISFCVLVAGLMVISWLFGYVYGADNCDCSSIVYTYNVSKWYINGSGLSFNFT